MLAMADVASSRVEVVDGLAEQFDVGIAFVELFLAGEEDGVSIEAVESLCRQESP